MTLPAHPQAPISALNEEWSALYPAYLTTDGPTPADTRFWFQESLHHPDVMLPFETIILDAVRLGFNQFNNRTFCIPQSYGIEQTIHRGYVYFSPAQPDLNDSEKIAGRVKVFEARAGRYFEDWEERWATWQDAVRVLIAETEALDLTCPQGPDIFEPDRRGQQYGGAWRLVSGYDRLVSALLETWQHHFEMLNLGYAGYFMFAGLFRENFPAASASDLAALFDGLSVLLKRPQEELSRLAVLARSCGLSDTILAAPDWQTLETALSGSSGGAAWLEAWDAAADPWFNYSSGSGLSAKDLAWKDDPEIPLRLLRHALAEGAEVPPARDTERREKREARFAHYRDLLPVDRRGDFEAAYRLAARVAPFLEDHNFFVEHWFQGVFWRQMRTLGDTLAKLGWLERGSDIFLFTRWELGSIVFDAAACWAGSSSPPRATALQAEARRREALLATLSAETPPPTLGQPPASVTDPVVSILWGIDEDLLRRWRAPDEGELRGIPASGGRYAGRAVVIRSTSDLARLRRGDVAVCRTLVPAWTADFARAGAVIAEIGGVLSHGAICCREWGISAVTGVANATNTIGEGSMVEVDGQTGLIRLVASLAEHATG